MYVSYNPANVQNSRFERTYLCVLPIGSLHRWNQIQRYAGHFARFVPGRLLFVHHALKAAESIVQAVTAAEHFQYLLGQHHLVPVCCAFHGAAVFVWGGGFESWSKVVFLIH